MNEEYQELYDIENATVEGGTVTEETISNDTFRFRLELSVDGSTTVTVRLCPPFENPDIENGEYDNGAIIRYQAYEPALLKLLYVNGETSVDETTDIAGVEFGFVQNYTLGDNEFGFTEVKTGANNLPYFEAGLSNAAGKGNPYNIRYLDITYSLNGGEEKTKRIYSGNLRYVNVGNNIYEIEANNDSTSIVAFYYEHGAQLSTWSLYDVRFVNTGTPLGSAKMPADPTYENTRYIFTNWDKNVLGGAPFLPYEKVEDDTVVYAQKTSTPDRGGTEIHVMNTDNELANRIMEIYNAENGTQLGSDSIDMDSVTIYATSEDGNTSTNPKYWNNGWRPLTGGNQYYRVINSDIAGDHPTISNDHIAHNDIGSITITATVNDTFFTVTLPVDETAPGAVSVSSVQDNIIEISVNGAPDAPTDDELTGDTGLLKEGAVKVICTNEEATHLLEEQTYGLLDGYTLSDVQWTGAGETGYYYVDITVPAAGYVTKFSTDSGADHALAPDAADTDTIRLQYADEGWKVMDEETPVTFEVTCTTESGGGDEDEPEAPDLSGVKIQVLCTNVEHPASRSYSLIDGSYRETMSENDGEYTYSVTVSAEEYVSQFSAKTGKTHRIDEEWSSDTLTIEYTYDGGSWQASGKDNLTFFVTCAESGEEQPTPPSITPDEVITLMGDNAIKVACQTEGSGHDPSSYSLIPGSFKVGSVTADGNGQYSCEITIDEDGILQYVDAYNEVVGSEHTAIYYGSITFTITYDGIKWLQPKLPAATINVVCVPDQEDELDDDDLNGILGGAITVQCISEEHHDYKILTANKLLENAYSVTKNADGTYTVTLDGEKYASAYSTYISGEIGENIAHQLVRAEDASFEITLTHDGIKWTYSPSPIVIEVTCKDDSGDEPGEPTPTPGPGGGDKPPYIPPVDPDDSGVSDLLNTDDHIQYLFGYPEGTFGPKNNMTRAEVAQMFYNLLLDQDVTITKTFDDVPANAWYAKAVNTLASLGVVSGVGNGDFEPERSITRAEFTSIAMKFAEGKTGGTNIFSDVKSTDWFYRAVVNSTQYGWIHGYGDGTFRPNNPITRVEVTAIVNNMLGREADVDFVTEHYDELNHFSDLEVSHWGYYHIVEATNDHDYTKPSSGENWTKLN